MNKFRKARIWSNDQLKYIAGFVSGDVVNVSGADDFDKQGSFYREYFQNANSYRISNYPDDDYRGMQGLEGEISLDLEKKLAPDLVSKFDVVLSHTVLEHVYDFKLAFHNMSLMTRDLLIVIVPFSQVQHDTNGYLDFWRFSPNALRRMCENDSMEVIYEKTNSCCIGASYLFFVASKNPDRWRRMIHSNPIGDNYSGYWNGFNLRDLVYCLIKSTFRRFF